MTGEESEVTLSPCTATGPKKLSPVSQLPPHLNKGGCDSQKLWPPQCPYFLKIFGLQSSSDLDLPQHSVDLPAHHASPGSPALWTHGLDSVH